MPNFSLRRAELPLAGNRHRPRAARGDEEPEAGRAVVSRVLGRGQVDHRQPHSNIDTIKSGIEKMKEAGEGHATEEKREASD
ncbi:unnamed protein product [Didymodactylos carnosus]|uniref:Uncharacterized protein n=1 Tax=Didymodactylos carnosus TaxID=1234261 RepID=A0A815H5P6_9BILA|nr:unnamed protein product [Didymodactylos carnosus]CAF4218934.1 unnamed protein product [Didymodactylos carnosus]